MALNVWDGIKHGIDTSNVYFQAWFVGTPIAWYVLLKLFRYLGLWSHKTRKGARTSDILAFEAVALISVAYLGVAGLILHMGWCGTDAELAVISADKMYGRSQFVINHLIYPMVTFQSWNVLLCLFTPDLNVPEMIGHHTVTAALGYFALHPYLHGCNFFFGVAELTNISLTVYDVFKYNKSVGWQKKYPLIFNITQGAFAFSFLAIRIVWWPLMSVPFWKDSIALIQSQRGHSNFVIGFFLLANVFLTLLQFYWGWMIVQSALGGAASLKKSSTTDDKVPTSTRVTRSTAKSRKSA